MSDYTGSVTINRIDWTKLRFLTSSTASTITSEEFNMTTGKPLNNITGGQQVDTFFSDIASNLYERVNINDDFIYRYPKVLETTALRDIQVTGETTIDVVFIYEGATMKNTFGYYMYYVDDDGNKHILDNDTDTQGYYYSPTVIYPHVYYVDGDSNTLQRGETRRLRGNLPNGNFENIYIGFFLVPHGWFAIENSSTIGNESILYSTTDFNIQYSTSEYQMVNDKIYSVYAKAVSGDNQLLFTAFEDVFVTGIDDLDYNDCVVGFIISDVTNIVDYDKYSTVQIVETTDPATLNNIICTDEDGEYVDFKSDVYTIDESHDHYFERHMYFDNQSDRDATYDAYTNLSTNYYYGCSKTMESSKYVLVSTYLFRKNDLKNADKDNGKNKQLYLFESKYDREDNSNVDAYKVAMQNNYSNVNYYERYKLWDAKTNAIIIDLTTVIDPPTIVGENNFRIIGNGVMDCLSEKSHLPAQATHIYQVYKNMSGSNGLVINVKMDVHPTGFMSGTKTFLRYVCFIANATEHVVIDLGNLTMYQETNGSLGSALTTFSSSNIVCSNVITNADQKVKLLVDVFRNDSGAYYRSVTINKMMTFYCIRFPNIKNNPTMIFLDTNFYLQWNNKYNVTGGTYYDKQHYYLASNFTTIV
ncbi:MAG: hypothetical protein Dasosvirus3_7 [Dasosvirus sp.]|uniref:Uncharacterized protein n=1 Tax=Dasosvirus sp. TaxID=2487764 RepID=A0A3G4ZRB8_9VIRU|nr:MAG: hypothetical protein Dasosvirus3_7 [Dasosvirus sp.]